MRKKMSEGDKCEVCASPRFVQIFCSAINGGEECRKLTERAAKGEMTQEEYFNEMIRLYGRDAVAKAFDKAMVKDKLETTIEPKPPVETKPPEPKPATGGAESAANKTVKAERLTETEKLAKGVASTKEQQEIEKLLKQGVPKFKTSIKAACLPCIGEPASAILSVVSLWYTGKDKETIQNLVKQMRNGEIYVEDAIKEVLKMDGGQDCYNEVLKELNRVTELAVDSALKEKPELAKTKKE